MWFSQKVLLPTQETSEVLTISRLPSNTASVHYTGALLSICVCWKSIKFRPSTTSTTCLFCWSWRLNITN